MESEVLDVALVVRGISERRDSHIKNPPRVFQDPRIIPRLLRLGIAYFPTEGRKEPVLSHQCGRES